MSTWLDQWDRRYTDRVRLLVDILPMLAQEPLFALKGGTAICSHFAIGTVEKCVEETFDE